MVQVRTTKTREMAKSVKDLGCGEHCEPPGPDSAAVHCRCCCQAHSPPPRAKGSNGVGTRVYGGGGDVSIDTDVPTPTTRDDGGVADILARARAKGLMKPLQGVKVVVERPTPKTWRVTLPDGVVVPEYAARDAEGRLTGRSASYERIRSWLRRQGANVTSAREEAAARAAEAGQPLARAAKAPTATPTATPKASGRPGVAAAARAFGARLAGGTTTMKEIVAAAAEATGQEPARAAEAVGACVYGYPDRPHEWERVARGVFRYVGPSEQ